MKKSISLALVIVMVLSSVALIFAGTNSISKGRSLSFSGNTANVTAYVSEAGSECTISAELYQGSTLVGYWDDMGMHSADISGSVPGCISGLTYRLEVTATVNGDPVTISSISKRCP